MASAVVVQMYGRVLFGLTQRPAVLVPGGPVKRGDHHAFPFAKAAGDVVLLVEALRRRIVGPGGEPCDWGNDKDILTINQINMANIEAGKFRIEIGAVQTPSTANRLQLTYVTFDELVADIEGRPGMAYARTRDVQVLVWKMTVSPKYLKAAFLMVLEDPDRNQGPIGKADDRMVRLQFAHDLTHLSEEALTEAANRADIKCNGAYVGCFGVGKPLVAYLRELCSLYGVDALLDVIRLMHRRGYYLTAEENEEIANLIRADDVRNYGSQDVAGYKGHENSWARVMVVSSVGALLQVGEEVEQWQRVLYAKFEELRATRSDMSMLVAVREHLMDLVPACDE